MFIHIINIAAQCATINHNQTASSRVKSTHTVVPGSIRAVLSIQIWCFRFNFWSSSDPQHMTMCCLHARHLGIKVEQRISKGFAIDSRDRVTKPKVLQCDVLLSSMYTQGSSSAPHVCLLFLLLSSVFHSYSFLFVCSSTFMSILGCCGFFCFKILFVKSFFCSSLKLRFVILRRWSGAALCCVVLSQADPSTETSSTKRRRNKSTHNHIPQEKFLWTSSAVLAALDEELLCNRATMKKTEKFTCELHIWDLFTHGPWWSGAAQAKLMWNWSPSRRCECEQKAI